MTVSENETRLPSPRILQFNLSDHRACRTKARI